MNYTLNFSWILFPLLCCEYVFICWWLYQCLCVSCRCWQRSQTTHGAHACFWFPAPYLKYTVVCERTSASPSILCSDSSILPPRSSVQTLLRRWRWRRFPAGENQTAAKQEKQTIAVSLHGKVLLLLNLTETFTLFSVPVLLHYVWIPQLSILFIRVRWEAL